MTVSNGQIANKDTFNNAFASKTANTGNTVTGIIDLNNSSDPNSGSRLTNVQQAINEAFDASGVAGQGDSTRKDYSSNNVVANGDSRKVAIGKLDAEFDPSTGHDHDGGNSKLVSALNLTNINKYKASWQSVNVLGASGTSVVVTTEFTGKTSGGGSAAVGVPTVPTYNKCELRAKDLGTFIEDAEGQRVYARITESGGVWTLSFYTLEAGVETAHSLALQDITVYFREVFTIDNVPTFSADDGFLGSLDMTADVVDASPTQRGVVSTGTQSFAGAKTFQGDVRVPALSTDKTDVATAATIASLSSLTSFIRMTGATETTVYGIGSGNNGKKLLVFNGSSANVIFNNEDLGASAVDRIITPDGLPITIEPNNSVGFIYDADTQRWVVSGSIGASATTGGVSDITPEGFNRILNGALELEEFQAWNSYTDASSTTPVDGVTKQTVTSVNPGTDTLTVTAHGYSNGNVVKFDSTANLPAGLEFAKTYYVISATANEFQVSLTLGGSAVDITDVGSGTISVYLQEGATTNILLYRDTGVFKLEGAASIVFEKTGVVNRQGSGWSVDFEIPSAEKYSIFTLDVTKIISGTFTPGTDTTDSDVTIWVYDVKNGTVIQPTQHKIFSADSTVPERILSVFQTTDSTRYRWIFHIQTTGTGAFQMFGDLWGASRLKKSFGPIVSDYKNTLSLVPSAGLGTPTLESYWHKRSGDTIRFRGYFKSGTVAASVAAIGLPASIKIDTAKFASTSQAQRVGGYTRISTGANITGLTDASFDGCLFFDGADDSNLYFNYQSGSNVLTKNNGSTMFNSNDGITFDFEIPVVGWSTQTQMSQDNGSSEISGRYSTSAGQSIPTGGAASIINFDGKNFDSLGLVQVGASWKCTSKTPIRMYVGAAILYTGASWTAGQETQLELYKNGTLYSILDDERMQANHSLPVSLQGSDLIDLNYGDYFDFRTEHNRGAATTLQANENFNYCSFMRVPNPSPILANEKILGRAQTGAGQTISTGQVVDFGDVTRDTHGLITTGVNWRVTAKEPCDIDVSVLLTFASVAWTAGQTADMQIRKNGVLYSYLDNYFCEASASKAVSLEGGDIVSLNAGDYFDIYASCPSVKNLHAVAGRVHIAFKVIK